MNGLSWWRPFPGTSCALTALRMINTWNPVKAEVLAESAQFAVTRSHTSPKGLSGTKHEVLHAPVAQLPLPSSSLPAAHWSHATNDVYQSAINEQELMSVPAPNDNGSIISFWVPSQSKPASSDHDSFMSFPNGGCAAVCQPVWRPSSRPSQLVVASPTVFCLQFITQKVSPMTSPATIHTQPLLKLALFLVGSPVRDACHPDPHSSFCSYLAARRSTKKAQKAAGFTFCGKPSKLACWLSGVCDHVPGLPISQSHLWALGSGSHIHSAVRTAGLQQLSS